MRAMGQGDANRDGGRYQQLDQKSQATWGYPKRGDVLTVTKEPEL